MIHTLLDWMVFAMGVAMCFAFLSRALSNLWMLRKLSYESNAEVIRLRAALQQIASLATPENPEDDERQFARMRGIAIGALPQEKP